MAGWITLLGSLFAALVLFLKWYLGAEQKQKRRQKYVWKLEQELRGALAAGNTTAIRRIMRKLRLYADEGSPAAKPDDTDNESR